MKQVLIDTHPVPGDNPILGHFFNPIRKKGSNYYNTKVITGCFCYVMLKCLRTFLA